MWPKIESLRFPKSIRQTLRSTRKPDIFPVDLRIIRNGALFGVDIGLVSFDKDMLVFDGVATSFSLPAKATSRIVNAAGFASSTRVPAKYEALEVDGQIVLIRPHAVLRRRNDFDIERQFRHALDDWRKSKPSRTAQALYPPIEVHPHAIHAVGDTRMKAAGVGLLAATTGIAVIFLHALGVAWPNPANFLLLGVGAFLVFWIRSLLSQADRIKAELTSIEAPRSPSPLSASQ